MQKPSTNIRTYLCIFGDYFPLDEFTKKIGIIPTEVRKKGEIYKIGKTQHESYTTTWTYELDYHLTSDPTSQINKLVDTFSNKVNIINYYLKPELFIANIKSFRFSTFDHDGLNFREFQMDE